MSGARYRLWQFWRLISKRISPDELAEVRGWLTPALFDVFCKLNPAERHHAYCVRQTLAAQGQADPDLLTAALLHDVGKSRMPLAVWEKVTIVLGNRFARPTVTAWGNDTGPATWWRRPFVNYHQHPGWGAEMIEAGGGNPRVVELVRRHQDKVAPDDPIYKFLSALQSADNSN
ncbi:MAG TPA: HDIG domain-containing protein [Anaerolineales bacterium]|nr:HDIG domain-containing protein [Anaerolineales bacterium]HLF03547.1 HDIG domain-containing protein [Anaerolineales bacterium]